MDGILNLKKYSIFKDGVEILTVQPSLDQYSFGEFKQVFLNDYLNITKTLPEQTLSSRFIFNLSQDEIRLDKDHSQSKIEIFYNNEKKDTDFFPIINEKLGIKIDENLWKNRFIQNPAQENLEGLVDQINTSLIDNLEFSTLENDILSNRDEEGKNKIKKYIDLKLKEASIEGEVNKYKNSKEEIEKLKQEISKLEKGNKSSQDLYESLKSLIKSKGELEEAIKRYQNYKNPISEGEKLNEIERRYRDLFEMKKETNNVAKTLNNTVRNSLRGRGIVVMFFVQILLTAVFFALSQNLLMLILGSIIILELLVSLAIINFFSPGDYDQSIMEIEPEIKIDTQKNTNSERYVNSAIYSSLDLEYQRVLDAISRRLNGKSLESLSLEIENSNKQYSELKSKLEKAPSKLSQDDYYKLRRELDILKIDIEGIEYNKALNLDLDKLGRYIKILKIKTSNLLPILVNGDVSLRNNVIRLI